MNNRLKAKPCNWLIFLLSLGMVNDSVAQAFDFKCLSQANGLPAAGVYHLAEDTLGRLLIGTEGGGFARYDGNVFTVWDHTNGLLADTIRCLLPTPEGIVYLGADGSGLWRFEDDEFTRVESPLLVKSEIRSFAMTADQSIWIGTMERGLLVMNGDSIRREPQINSNSVRALLVTTEGTLIVGTDRGLFKRNDDQFTALNEHTGGLPAKAIYCLFEDSVGRIWAGTEDGPLVVDEDGWSFTNYAALKQERIRTINEDQQGDLWFGTQNGAFELEVTSDILHHYTTESGLSNNRIRNIYRDRSGTLWFSTFFGGICQLTSQAVVFFNREQGFPESPVNTIELINDSIVWFGTFDGGLFTWYEGSRPERIYQTKSTAQQNMITAISRQNDMVIAATEFDGVIVFDLNGKRKQQITNLPGGWVTGEILSFDALKSSAIACGSKAILIDERVISVHDIGVERINCLANDDSQIYIGTATGLFTFDPENDALPERIQGTETLDVSSIVIDNTGQVWFGTLRDGLFRCRNGIVKKPTQRYLPDPRVLGLSLDLVEDLWVATRKGITHLELDPTQEIILGSTDYGPEHGLTAQINGRAMVWDLKNQLWMGSSRGLFRLDPEGDYFNPTPPGVRITNLRLNYENVDWSEKKFDELVHNLPVGLVLPHFNNHLTFDFKAIDLSDPEKIVFQCLLEGYDPEWVLLEHRKSHTYPVLPPGEYTFKLRSRNSSGLWNETPVEYAFIIKAPFYASPWFIAGGSLFIIFIVYSFFRLRLRRLRIRNEELERTVNERTKQVREEQEKSDRLLLNILPVKTAKELKETGTAKAKRHDHTSVLFSDLKGFTSMTEQMTPDELVRMLHETFKRFDSHCDEFGIEKIKTIGDAYMCAAGLSIDSDDHAVNIIRFAMKMLEAVEEVNRLFKDSGMPECQIRIGIHSGPVIAGVVGEKKFAYDVWGDTVNTAARMESSGEIGRINISATTYELVKHCFNCESRGKIDAKNKGAIEMYFVNTEGQT